MSNRLITFEELAGDWDRTVKKSGIDSREFALAIAYSLAHAYDAEEERQVRMIYGLTSPDERACISCGSATQPCCGH
jgi:hypothetical protein